MLKVNTQRATKLLGTVLLASVLTTACKGGEPSAKASGPSAVPVKLQVLSSSPVEDSSEFVGSLEALERVSLQPQIQGRIVKIPVANGTRVNRGALIVLLSPDQTEADVASATAATNSARAARATAAAQLQAAEADQARAAADVKLQKVQFQRAEALVTQGAQAKQQLDIARNNLDTAIATLRAAQKQVGAARATINEAEAGIREAEANTASRSVNVKFKQVLAPIDGVVGDFPIKLGDYVNTGQTLTTITRNDFLDMRLSVPINQASQLRAGLPVELIDPNTRKLLTNGKIYFISPTVNTGDQAVLVKARFPNQNGSLRDRQFVRARVIWSQRPGVLIPTTAVSSIGAQSFVFVAEKGEKPVVRQRPIKLGNIQGQSYQVLDGVKPGEEIAVTQILNLRDGTPIKPES